MGQRSAESCLTRIHGKSIGSFVDVRMMLLFNKNVFRVSLNSRAHTSRNRTATPLHGRKRGISWWVPGLAEPKLKVFCSRGREGNLRLKVRNAGPCCGTWLHRVAQRGRSKRWGARSRREVALGAGLPKSGSGKGSLDKGDQNFWPRSL